MEAPRKNVLVLFEPGRAGVAAVDLARELAEHEQAAVTVVGVVPQASSGTCGASSASGFNAIVQETVARELDQARAQLGEIGDHAEFKLLREGVDPPLHEWAASAGVDVVLLPARRRPLRSIKHPAAAALVRHSGAEVRIVDARRGAI